MKCKLIFADGTVLNQVTIDNGVYSSETEVTEEMLNDAALETVKVVFEDETEQTLRFAKHDMIYIVDGAWHFVLVPASVNDLKMNELRSDMETALNELLDFVIGGEV